MATTTTNYGLKKSEGDDVIGINADQNYNMDIIDGALAAKQDGVTAELISDDKYQLVL